MFPRKNPFHILEELHMGLIKKLWAGEKVYCPACKNGILLPKRFDLVVKENKQFVCSACGNQLTVFLTMPKTT